MHFFLYVPFGHKRMLAFYSSILSQDSFVLLLLLIAFPLSLSLLSQLIRTDNELMGIVEIKHHDCRALSL